MKEFIRKNIPRVIAVVILFALYALTVPSSLTRTEEQSISKAYAFSIQELYEPQDASPNKIRAVHPQYEHISAWISSVGAAVTVTDLDADGIANDVIHVDPRFDRVMVAPAEEGQARYTPFSLKPEGLQYDEKTMAPMGSLADDFNEDGQMDVLVYYWGRTPVIFYQQDGSFAAFDLHPSSERWFTNAATLADFDGDGHFDILIGNYFPDGSRVLDKDATDNNQVMQHSMTRADNGGYNHLYLWNGQTKGPANFAEDRNWLKGLEKAKDWTLAVAAGDINGDMLPELYISNDFGPDKLLYNKSRKGEVSFRMLKGRKKIRTIGSAALGKDSFKGMGADMGDINNDGLLDIYVSNIADEYALEESHFLFTCNGNLDLMEAGVAPYENKSEELGLSRSSWGWDSKLADFNNDGQLEAVQATGFVKGDINRWPELQELAMGNDELLSKPEVWPRFQQGDDLSGYEPNPFFVMNSDGKFYDVSALLGIDQKQVTRGIAIADIEHDGDLDFFAANQWEASRLYLNTTKSRGNFLGIVPLLSSTSEKVSILKDATVDGTSKYAIGATARLILPNGEERVDYVDGGNGHSGANSPELFFGLGDIGENAPVNLELSWRNSEGEIQKETLSLTAGWHTISLPW